MTWNHRVMKIRDRLGEDNLQIHEVYYNEAGRPNGYTKDPVGVVGDTIEELATTLQRMTECLKKPVLSPEDTLGKKEDI